MPEKIPEIPPDSREELAAFWRVDVRTLTNWANMNPPAPTHDVALMIQWAALQKKLSTGCRRRVEELRRQHVGVGGMAGASAAGADPDWDEFSNLPTAPGDDPKAALAAIERARDYAAFKFEKASQISDRDGMKFYSDLLVKFEGAIHDAQLRARKLGMDEGELLPRPEVERIAFAIAYWLLRSTDLHLDALTGKLCALSPGLEAEPVRRVLEPELLSDRFLVPFARAAKISAGVTVPEWVVAKMRTAAGDFLENGEAAFDGEAQMSPSR